ncbi:MAG: malate synthase A [Pseudomonadota bacterium]
MATPFSHNDVTVTVPVSPLFSETLTPDALSFVGALCQAFETRRQELLSARVSRQETFDAGALPGFLEATREIRERDWRIDPVPADLVDRRVEITGPVDRKMVINALNSGAKTYMADFEDSHSPTWEATIAGQINLRDAVNRTITYTAPDGRRYALDKQTATLIVRPRGWHLPEKHVLVGGVPASGSLFDFGMFFFHNAKNLLSRGSGPYFYLPKMESHLEARLWNDVFVMAQERLSLPQGTIKATVLIETVPAAFEMDEILYELRHHMAGLNCGRWDYIFSFIKRLKKHPEYLFPDRAQITMTRHCMRSYSLLAIRTCHRRGAHAIGGMAAQIPIKSDPAANAVAMEKVREDKRREASDGHDGTWVAHPGLVAVAKGEFDRLMPTANQIHRLRDDVAVTTADLLKLPSGTITEAGFRTNVSVGIQYMAHWLSGNGCVPLYHLMEDAATAEISRTQLWQWVHHPKAAIDDGSPVDTALFKATLAEELEKITASAGSETVSPEHYAKAAQLFEDIVCNDALEEFLTLRAYTFLD